MGNGAYILDELKHDLSGKPYSKKWLRLLATW